MLDHARICSELFPRPTSSGVASIYDGYIAAMRSARYQSLIDEFEINTINRAAMLLATWAHETGGFRVMREDGNYTSADRIMQIFGVGRHSAKITASEAARLVRNPYALFERVYGVGNPRKSVELGNVDVGDGYLYRGCGIQQLTGRADHERYASELGCPVTALSEPINSIHAALIEWRNKGCNAAADDNDAERVRRLINGGMNGWEDFIAKVALIRKALSATPPEDDGVISLGDRGAEVLAMQDALRAHGFYESGTMDGIFGAITKRALVAFQSAHGLPPSGIYDDATRDALNTLPTEPTLPGRKSPEPSRITERVRARGVALWKKLLTALGIYEGSNQLGLEPAEKVLSVADRIKSLIGKIHMQPRFIAYAVVAVLIYITVRWTRNLTDDET